MTDLLHALLGQGFMRNALIATVLASLGCGVVGTYVVAKRIGYLAGGIAHAVLGGMGAAYFLGRDPLHGAVVAALGAALLIGWVSLRWRQQEDVIISALWAVGMAVGVIFISQTPGYNVDLMSFLFGSVLMVSGNDLLVMAGLDVVIAAMAALFYKQFLAICFDAEFARVRGVNVPVFYLLLLCMVAVTVVLLIQLVGLILVIALLTLPAAIAQQFARSLVGIMTAAALLGATFSIAGLAASYATDLPTGPVIILLTGFGYVVALLLKGLRRRLTG
jgi:zinc transport system permease protein